MSDLAENPPASSVESIQGDAERPLALMPDEGWAVFANCGEMGQLFFEPFGERPGARARREVKAKAICAQCPVQLSCRESGRQNNESGIWGGETEEERALAGFAPKSISRRSVAQARLKGQD